MLNGLSEPEPQCRCRAVANGDCAKSKPKRLRLPTPLDYERNTAMVQPTEPPQPAVSKVHASLLLSESHTLQVVEFKPGITGVVETGRVMVDDPVRILEGGRPEEVGTARAGGDAQRYAGDTDFEADSGEDELAWFRRTFCNGAQECVQGY